MNIKTKLNQNGKVTSLLLIAFVFYAAASLVFAQEMSSTPVKQVSEIEMSCRLKAKEVAAETYRGCVSEQKNAQVEMLKKEYAEKLSSLKAHYEEELKKMNAKSRSVESAPLTTQSIHKKNEIATKEEVRKNLKGSKALAKVKASNKFEGSNLESRKSKGSSDGVSEMTVQLKPAPQEPAGDESVLDLPEPTNTEAPEL